MLLLFLMVNNNFALFMNRFLQLLILQLLPKHWENYYCCLLSFLSYNAACLFFAWCCC